MSQEAQTNNNASTNNQQTNQQGDGGADPGENSQQNANASGSGGGVDPGYERYKKDMLKYKDRVQELEGELENQRLNKLKEQERHQELAEEWRLKAEEAQSKAENYQKSMVFDKKFSAVRESALKSGIRKEALADLELVDFDEVEVEVTSTGRINVLGADKAVERLKTTRPHWFGRKSNSINSGEVDIQPGTKVTYSDIYKAEQDAKKSGDYSQYKALLEKFRNQQRSG